MTHACVKVWKEPMTPVIKVNRITGEIIGMVMCQKRRNLLAPSIVAASYSCVGTPWSAER